MKNESGSYSTGHVADERPEELWVRGAQGRVFRVENGCETHQEHDHMDYSPQDEQRPGNFRH